MAYGGGTFTTQNKALPGTYFQFVSAAANSVSSLSRGKVAIAMELDWGTDGKMICATSEEAQKNSLSLFGYPYDAPQLKGIRDVFRNAQTLYCYKLNSSGTKASNDYATAVCSGIRGNALQVVIQANTTNSSKFDISLYFDGKLVDFQTVTDASELTNNDYVTWKKDVDLTITAGASLTGGANGEKVTASDHQQFLDKAESYEFNAIGAVTDSTEIAALYTAYTKRMRDEVGLKFQAVLYNTSADYEGVVNVRNKATDSEHNAASLVYWVTGLIAGCEVGETNMNRIYDGEFTPDVDLTQTQLSDALQAGEFVLHRAGDTIRVLSDINSLVTYTADKGAVFRQNQTIRTIDQIATDIAALFTEKYLGRIPNDEDGRNALWSDIIQHHKALEASRAISDFSEEDVIVSAGTEKQSVVVQDNITVIGTMEQLYMTITVA